MLGQALTFWRILTEAKHWGLTWCQPESWGKISERGSSGKRVPFPCGKCLWGMAVKCPVYLKVSLPICKNTELPEPLLENQGLENFSYFSSFLRQHLEEKQGTINNWKKPTILAISRFGEGGDRPPDDSNFLIVWSLRIMELPRI